MQKRSHKQLASALLRSRQGFNAKRFELAFLFGSFQPDCNPFSYLKGSRTGRTFGGHSYCNSQHYIETQIEKLQRRTAEWTIWQYYTLGKLTHYLADAFTYPHNVRFLDSCRTHHQYETNLRLYLAERLTQQLPQQAAICQNPAKAIAKLHRSYMAGGGTPQRDARYILQAMSLLMAACLPVVG